MVPDAIPNTSSNELQGQISSHMLKNIFNIQASASLARQYSNNESHCRHFVTTSQNKMVPDAIPNTSSNELQGQISSFLHHSA
jgi:hypothetical protein